MAQRDIRAQKILVKTWMYEMGFEVVTEKKGTYVDGHEREDVVEYRTTFLRCMASLGFLNALQKSQVRLFLNFRAPR